MITMTVRWQNYIEGDQYDVCVAVGSQERNDFNINNVVI